MDKRKNTSPTVPITPEPVTKKPKAGNGIGESVFYAYFFKRYSNENPSTWIIMTAFNSDATLEEVVVKIDREVKTERYKPEKQELIKSTVIAATLEECPLLMLCDGPPKMRTRDMQMVCFTSPNEGWFKETEKENESTWLYMPLWTREELVTASVALDLDLDDDMLTARFNVFGGEARMCLNRYEDNVQTKKKVLQAKISGIDRLDTVEKLLRSEECEKKRHRIIHYESDEDATFYYPRIASTFVEYMLAKNALRLTADGRQVFIEMLAGVGEAGALRGYFFEARAHNVLGKGLVTINARSLGDGPKAPREELKVDCRNSSEPKLFQYPPLPGFATEGSYHVSSTKTLPAIDSFYLPKAPAEDRELKESAQEWNKHERLLLFQMTVSMYHPVKAAALVDVLSKLGLLEIVKRDPSRVGLVFVVPKENEVKFEKQQIEGVATEGAVELISGIGRKIAKKLHRQGMTTIQEALEAFQKGRLTTCKTVVERHQQAIECADMLERMPQYAWSI